MERQGPSREDYNKPLPKQQALPPLPLLPEREWLNGRINKVDYEYVYFKGNLQYITNQKTGEQVLDGNEQPIPRRQFNIEILCEAFNLPNGQPRKAWIKLGASLNPKANLSKFLANMEMDTEGENPTPQVIIDFLQDKDIKFQMANKIGGNGQEYQQVVWDAVKPI